jgi:hypothetical protein
MTATLGGGGGKDSFVRILKHIAPAANEWREDMRKHSLDINDDNIKTLDTAVQKMLDKYNLATFAPKRDQLLVEVLRLKEKAVAKE